MQEYLPGFKCEDVLFEITHTIVNDGHNSKFPFFLRSLKI